MKKNDIILDLSKGNWFFDINQLGFWGLQAEKLLANPEKYFLKEDLSQKERINAFVSLLNDKANVINLDKGQKIPKGSVAQIDMKGPLMKYSGLCTYGADEIVNALYEIDSNSMIDAIVCYMDGPGGSASAIAPFIEYGKHKTKPVVVLFEQCCSAHFYAALGFADHIMAANNISAMIGSLGIVMTAQDNREYLKQKGIITHEIYPKESEHKNEAFRLAMDGKYELISEEILSPLAIKFQNQAIKSRPNLIQEKGVLTGKTFFADEALRLNMIDSIGSMRQAVQVALGLAEIKRFNK
jgi:protease-4